MTAVTPTGGFMLRTPLLPAATLDALLAGLRTTPDHVDDATVAADVDTLADRLRDLLADPAVREALYVTSPGLVAGLDAWFAGEPADVLSLVRSTVKYVTRMCLRPTPFGLLAGCTVGPVGAGTLRLAPRAAYRRVTRLDFGFLTGVVARVENDATLRAGLTFYPNSGLYRGGGRLRLAERRVGGGAVRYHRVAVQEDGALAMVLDAAIGGATLDDLAKPLVGDDVTFPEAREYVDQLVDAQLLTSDLGPRITGDDAATELVAHLGEQDATRDLATVLGNAVRAAGDLDAQGVGADVQGYHALAAAARAVDPDLPGGRLVQVDMYKPGDGLALPTAVAREVARAAELLHRIHPPAVEDELTAFRDAFVQRFEDREVPLAIALDEELGVGFGPGGGPDVEGAPLLADLKGLPSRAGALPWRRPDSYVLRLVERTIASGDAELRLTDRDVEALSGAAPPLVRSFAAAATVVATGADAVDRGDFTLLFRRANGPSGAQAFGRFCHLDPVVEQTVRDHIAAEEAAEPDAVFAEIVHLPQGRIGNILARPVLRAYEIPFLGGSGAAAEAQLPVGDLTVSVCNGRVVLRSAHLGREVLPRLSNAHYFPTAALAVYRFLASLQYQGRAASLMWRWGALDGAPYLPRVVHGRTVLERATWWVQPDEVAAVADAATPAERYAAVQSLRTARALPRWVVLAESDNELPVDLDTVAGTELFAHEARRRRPMRLVERFPEPDGLCVEGPEGAYANEIVVLLRSDAPRVTPPVAHGLADRLPAPEGFGDTFLPGSEWTYAKLYAGRTSADDVLRGVVGPVIAAAREFGACDRWFFLRYRDPDHAVRLRLHGDAATLLPLLDRAAAPFVADHTIARVQLDTYRREVDRYGGPHGVLLAERLFEADSEAALSVLRVLNGDASVPDRWRLALASIDRMHTALGLTPDERRVTLRGWRDELAAEHGETGVAARRLAGRLFRTERAVLAPLIEGRAESLRLQAGLAALNTRDAVVREVAADLRALHAAGHLGRPLPVLAVSFGHLSVLRLLRGVPRLQELVLCDLLDRLYAAR